MLGVPFGNTGVCCGVELRAQSILPPGGRILFELWREASTALCVRMGIIEEPSGLTVKKHQPAIASLAHTQGYRVRLPKHEELRRVSAARFAEKYGITSIRKPE